MLGPLNSLVWYVPSLRYTRGLGWRMHCGVKVTESSTNKQHHIYRERSLRLHVAGLVEGSRRCWKEGSAPVPQSLCNELSAPVRETPKSRFFSPNNVQSVCRRTCRFGERLFCCFSECCFQRVKKNQGLLCRKSVKILSGPIVLGPGAIACV